MHQHPAVVWKAALDNVMFLFPHPIWLTQSEYSALTTTLSDSHHVSHPCFLPLHPPIEKLLQNLGKLPLIDVFIFPSGSHVVPTCFVANLTHRPSPPSLSLPSCLGRQHRQTHLYLPATPPMTIRTHPPIPNHVRAPCGQKAPTWGSEQHSHHLHRGSCFCYLSSETDRDVTSEVLKWSPCIVYCLILLCVSTW